MKKLILGVLLSLAATAVAAQGIAVGVGAVAGAVAGSASVVKLVVSTPTLAPEIATGTATNTTTSAASVLLPALSVNPLLAGTSTASGIPVANTTTTSTGNMSLPVGGTGAVGAAGAGLSFAAGGSFVGVTLFGPPPVLPVLLPALPSLNIIIPAL
jgi:hypothetical protein